LIAITAVFCPLTAWVPAKHQVVGAGVAGLVCARHLRRAGLQVEVFEAADGVGGRVRTDKIEVELPGRSGQGTFLLDRGFQILIEAYPEVKRQLDFKRLGLRSFAPGAFLAFGSGELRIVSDPIRSPKYIFSTLLSGIASIKDLLLLSVLRLKQVLFERPYTALEGDNLLNTEDFLCQLGLSAELVNRFLRPFFEAIYVTPLAQQSSGCFRFVLKMLAEGRTSLPERGMQAVSEQLAEGLFVRVCSPVAEIRAKQLRIGSEWKDFDAVVLATDLPSASKLFSEMESCKGTSSSTWYFALPSPPPVTEPLIVLNSTLQGKTEDAVRLVDVAFPSLVQPTYAPTGWDLAAVTVRLPENTTLGDKEGWLRSELETLFGTSLETWKLLRVYHLPFHQPAQQRKLWPPRDPLFSGIYVCGDHCAEPTLDSAMRSGRFAAEAILKDLQSTG